MALKEQDIVLTSKDAQGNTVVRMPVTRVENVEGALKTVNGVKPDENGNVNVKEYEHPNSGVAAGTYNSVTVNAQGHVTAGSNTQFAAVATSGNYNDLTNRPALHAVATSGNYNDLSNRPSIPANTSNWSFSSGASGWARDNSTGFTIQWGRNSSTSTTFPRAFSQVYSIAAYGTYGGSRSDHTDNIGEFTNTYFTTSNTFNNYWIAVGVIW